MGLPATPVVPGTEGECVENPTRNVWMQGLASFSVLEHLPGAGFYAQRSKRAGWEPMSL